MDDMQANWKRQAAEHAVAECIRSRMVIGLGHGSTAIFALRRIAQLLHEGRLTGLTGIPCSTQVQHDAEALGIPLATLDDYPQIDVTIDGADEATTELQVIKGGGGAFLREKMVAQASRREVIVIDETKLSSRLGARTPVPVEVVPFGWQAQVRFLRTLGATAVDLRCHDDRTPWRTDQGNLILDCRFPPLDDPAAIARALQDRAGMVEHGLFLGLATDLIIAGAQGITHLTRTSNDQGTMDDRR
jgi:ribose 5-phosphate isomerase A